MIPPLNETGLLPDGIHDCTLAEVGAQFGAFQGTDRRPQLWAGFTEFVREVKACGVVDVVLVDGSFVTAEATPNDIDLVLVVSANYDFSADFQPSNTTSCQSGGSIGALDSTSWSRAPTRRNTVATWGSFNKSGWNQAAKRAY